MNDDKNSLPDLPDGWVWTRVGEVCLKPQYGWTTSAATEGKLHLLRTTDITHGSIDWDSVPFCKKEPSNKEKYLLEDGDIVISRAGSVGYSYLIKNPKEAVFASYLIRFKPLIEERYLAFFLKSPSYWDAISDKSSGIALLNVNATKLKQIFLPLPPVAEQYKIVEKIEEVFTKLDAGIESLKKAQVQLKRYRQAVLKSAMEGKLTEDWREAHEDELEPASVRLELIKAKRMKSTRRSKKLPPLETEDQPQLPEGWVWTRVGVLADIIHYGYTESATKEPIGPKFLRITDIQNNEVNWDTVPYCKIDDNKKMKYLLKEGDLVFARTGATVGKSYLIRGKIPDAVFASYLIRIIINEQIDKRYVYNCFQSSSYWRQIHKGKIGIGQPNVNAQILSRIIIPLPPLMEQHKIVEEIECRLSVADEVEKTVESELKRSERLRQSILKQAFSGKLVPQNPDDEPANVLLEKIKAEKARQKSKKKSRRKSKAKKNAKQMRLL